MYIHMCINIRGFMRNNSFPIEYENVLKGKDGKMLSPYEAHEFLCDELAKGHELINCGDCDKFDPKTGCLGHEEDDAA